MLQIRLIRDSSLEIGGSAKPSPVETVTVACPDHLVLADLPVAKSLAAAPSASIVKTVGRRSRRHLGERVHVCVRCDFPIAIYGRLSPCEHAFCLACARSDSSCYLCDERIQKIQTIKMLEGIFICAAPHCLKSFLKRPEFEAHIHETHTDLLQQPIAVVKEELNNETDSFAVARLPSSSASDVAQGKQPPPDSSSTPLGQPRLAGFPHTSNFQQTHDREDRSRWHQPREAPAAASPPNVQQPKPPPMFYSPHMHQVPESQPENNYLQQQGFDRPPPFSNNNRFPLHQQSFDNQLGATHYRRDNDQLPDKQSGILPEPSSFPEYPLPHSFHHHHQLPSLQGPSNATTQAPPLPPPFGYNMPLPTEGSQQSQPYYNSNVNNPHGEMNRPESEVGSLEPPGGSLLGFPPTAHPLPGLASTNYPRVWNMGLSPMPPFEPFAGAGQGPREGGYGNPSADNTASTTSSQSQGRAPFYRANHGWGPGGLSSFEVPVGSGTSERKDGKGVLAPLPSPLPLPPPPPPLSQYERGKFTSSASGGSGDVGREGGQGYGRHGDRRGFGSGQD